MKFNNFVKLFSDAKVGFDSRKLTELLDGAFSEVQTDEFITKENFAPSTLLYPYGPGGCPRYWYLARRGAQFEKRVDAYSADNMKSGTDAHTRIQANFANSGIEVEIEQELFYDDPPIHAFVDLVVKNFDGLEIPIEIKTTRAEAFAYLVARNEGREYQVMQLLIYMYIRGDQYGALIYENKNDHKKLLIPVEMTLENKAKVEALFDWARMVRDLEELPKKPYRSNSKICKACPIKNWCFSQEEGTITVDTLSYTEEG